MTLITTLSRAAGLGLCVVAFSGTALANPGNGNGNAPATPPGQEKKADEAAAPAAPPAAEPAPQAAAPGQEKKAAAAPAAPAAKPAKAEKPAKSPQPATPPGQAKKAEKQAEHKPAKAASESKGQSANAQHHVIVCHRTGSLSNPYVVLNIPWTAWTNGHTTHPAKNGNVDKILKDPASRPGSKDGFTKADCGASVAPPSTTLTPAATEQAQTADCTTVTTSEQVLVGIWHATGAYNKDGTRKYVLISPSMKAAHWDKHADDKPAYETRTVTRTRSGENCATVTSTSNTSNPSSASNVAGTANTQSASQASVAATQAAPVGGVAGAVSPASAAEKPAGGVLGAIASAPEAIADTAAAGTLPFTGFPLWMAVLIALAVLVTGLILRRRTGTTA